jgi:hypothetical protein
MKLVTAYDELIHYWVHFVLHMGILLSLLHKITWKEATFTKRML